MSRRATLNASSAALATVNLPPVPANKLVNAEGAAEAVDLSLAALWRAVAAKRLPAPVYPAPRAPRWYLHELHAALEATRALPREAMAARRTAKLAGARDA